MTPGTKLGPYEIVSPLGAGGMGEVYKARDTRLDRTVAVKVLPSHIAKRDDLRARFEREARAVSSLNHPNICSLFDVGTHDGVGYMVMEHIEGETLAERIKTKGPLPLDQSLKYPIQIADALDRAHRSGVVHRDMKPSNVMLNRDGVKVLDFGLAKTAPKTAAPDDATLTAELTSEGTVLGTPQYMAPEQYEGNEADARSDIFSFGCLVYEMVAGRRAFDGKTKASVIAAVLGADPPSMRVACPLLPTTLERLVMRCLAKNPDNRWQSMRDIFLELCAIEVASLDTSEKDAPHSLRAWVVTGVLGIALVVVSLLLMRKAAPVMPSTRFLLAPSVESLIPDATAISPDGRYLVIGQGRQENWSLWLRPLDSISARQLPGTERAIAPFWSPDSRMIAFFAGGKLKRSDAIDGTTQVLCDAESILATGGTWNRDGLILFGSAQGLMRVPALGGVPQRLTQVDPAHQESEHGSPQFLPDGKHFLYFVPSTDRTVQGIYAASLDNPGARVRILATDRKASYVPAPDRRSGFLLWMRNQTLLAQPFDESRLRLNGDATPIAEDVTPAAATRRADYWSSDSGGLVYRAGFALPKASLVWLSREGKRLSEMRTEDRYGGFELSPDGKRVAITIRNEGGNPDVFLMEIGSNVVTRLTIDPKPETNPKWSPDGHRIAFTSDRSGVRQIYLREAGDGGREEQLTLEKT